MVKKKNDYLANHKKAKVETAVKDVKARLDKLKIEKWAKVGFDGRRITITKDEEALMEQAYLDGCYVIKTDLAKEIASAKTVHNRYKDLAEVEWAFRTCKTAHLELNPWYVKTESSTRGHALTVMLSYLILRELRRVWTSLEVTPEEGIARLSTLTSVEITVAGVPAFSRIPTPRPSSGELLESARVVLPASIPNYNAPVVTRKKLVPTRLTL